MAQTGAQNLNLKKGLISDGKRVHINYSLSAGPKLALVPACRYEYNVYTSNIYDCAVSSGMNESLKGIQRNFIWGLFILKTRAYQCFYVYFPETSSCANKPL